MSTGRTRTTSEIDPRTVKVRFSEGVKRALADLEAAIHFSEHVNQESHFTLQELARGKSFSVDDVIGSLPLIAENVFHHVQVTNDQKAIEAWRELSSELLESGFKLERARERTR